MPTLIPHHLAFRGGLHVGTRGVNLEEAGLSIPADTLFAAILDACRRQGWDAGDFAAPFLSPAPDPPFLLTSAFPLVGQLRFYPAPVALDRLLQPETIHRQGKTARRIRYLSEGLLRKALAGGWLDDDLFPANSQDEPVKGAALQNGALWFGLDELNRLPQPFQRGAGKRHALIRLKAWEQERVPRVTISRITQASAVFSAGRVVFARDCGLWFGVAWRQPERALPGGRTYRAALDAILASLQEDGLGGERASGYGAFIHTPGEPVALGSEPQGGKPAWLLSRYHPRPEELPAALDPAAGAAYSLVAVAGWARSLDGAAQRRKRLVLVGEGSQIAPPAYPAGDVTDVRPTYLNPAGDLPHPVYRYGLAFGLGW